MKKILLLAIFITGCGGEIYYLDSYNYNQLGDSSYETKQLESPELEGASIEAYEFIANEIISGYGTVITFEFVKGKAAAFKFMNKLEIVIISNNLGDAKSIATHPATTTHQRLTEKQKDDLQISEGLIRLSVGLEDTDDLINDVSSALRTL